MHDFCVETPPLLVVMHNHLSGRRRAYEKVGCSVHIPSICMYRKL